MKKHLIRITGHDAQLTSISTGIQNITFLCRLMEGGDKITEHLTL